VTARIKWFGVADGTANTVPVESISRESTNVTVLKNHTTVASFRMVLDGLRKSVSVSDRKEKKSVEARKRKRGLELARPLDNRRTEACDIFDAEYRCQVGTLARGAIVGTWVNGSVEVFSEWTDTIELTLSNLTPQRSKTAVISRGEDISGCGLSYNLMC